MYPWYDILTGRTNMMSHNSARASDVTVKININSIFTSIDYWKDTLRSFYYRSAFDDISNVFLQTGVDIRVNLFSICLQYTCLCYCLKLTCRWISMLAIFRLG